MKLSIVNNTKLYKLPVNVSPQNENEKQNNNLTNALRLASKTGSK